MSISTIGAYSSVRHIGASGHPGIDDAKSDEALVVTDAYGRIVNVSPSAATLLGTRAKSIVSKLLVYRLAAASRPQWARTLANLRAAEPVEPFVALLRPIRGEAFRARISGEHLAPSAALFLFELRREDALEPVDAP